jgi:redox-sensitive bicupin YhaK (pirin superfamily)
VEVRRAAERFTTVGDGTVTHHSFSFGRHYDPGNVGFGALVAHNDEHLAPGAGYAEHAHSDVEIVSWVVEGVLRHEDSAGRAELVGGGSVQRLVSGPGVRHSEVNGGDVPLRFVQAWLRPGRDSAPSYARADVTADLAAGALVVVASGDPDIDAPVGLVTDGAVLRVARLHHGDEVSLPAAAHVHVFVARGALHVDDVGDLEAGDALRLRRDGDRSVTARADAELLVWSMR